MKTVAIVKDKTQYYPIYEKILQEYGYQVKLYDVWQESQLDAMLYDSFDAFIWRAKHNPNIRKLARRFLYFFNQEMQLPTYPDWHSYWHYDDKIAQSMLFKKFDIPTPKTDVFVSKDKALEFVENIAYPIIYKCAHGAGSSNVGLLKNKLQASKYVKKVFGRGLETYFSGERQNGYVYFQEFMPHNDGDYRIICSRDYVMRAVFRHNRKNAPFASGSGNADIIELPDSLQKLGSSINKKLNFDFMSYDYIKNLQGEWVVTEISVIYGDFNFPYYDQSFLYLKENDIWQKKEPVNEVERTIRFLINDVWNWR